MNFINSLKTGRRGFIASLAGISSGFLFMNPGQVWASKPKIREFFHTLKKDALKSSKPKQNQLVILKDIKGEKVELYKKGSRQPVCTMNRPGKMIWDMCNGKNTLSAMASEIERQYTVSFEQSYADCMIFINNLNNIGVIRL